MNENGYIKLHRKIREWGWYSDSNTKAVFLELLLTANWDEPGEYKGVTINTGDAVIGRKAMAKKLGITESQVRTAIEHLKITNEIAIKTTNKFTVISIVKWREYQVCDEKNRQENRQEEHQQIANKSPTNRHIIRNKEIKNIKNNINLTRARVENEQKLWITSDGKEYADPNMANEHEKFLKLKECGVYV